MREEREAVVTGQLRPGNTVALLEGVSKSYWQQAEHGQQEVRAVAGVWLGIRPGGCFGLQGTNGAGAILWV